MKREFYIHKQSRTCPYCKKTWIEYTNQVIELKEVDEK